MPTTKNSKKLAFDNQKYLKIQIDNINKRIASFGGKLYLEFGGKLFDDFHASRVLPGFKPDSKLDVLLSLKDKAEIVFAINTNDIKSIKVRNDLGITYQSEVERLIDAYRSVGLLVSSVVLCLYEPSPAVNSFSKKLTKNGIKVYKHYKIEGYPRNTEMVLGPNGLVKNDYVETSHPLVVVTAPGPGSGKMAVCLSQLYQDFKRGIKSGYAKYETFPVWNLPLKHPINLAYEAATADLNDVNMIDPYHLEKYGITAVNYNRDIESFPVLKTIFEKIYSKSPYNSPTDMGVNMLGFAITNEKIAIEASKQEIVRRHYQIKKAVYLGKLDESVQTKVDYLMETLSIDENYRCCVAPCLEKAKKAQELAIAIELPNHKIVTGKRSKLLASSSAALLNALKLLAGIDDDFMLLSPTVIQPIVDLKTGHLQKENPRIRAEEILIALAIQASNNPLAELALKQLPKLKGAQVHCSCILSQSDLRTLTTLGMNVTEEPVAYAHKLYVK